MSGKQDILPPIPEWAKMDDLGGLVPSEVRQGLVQYGKDAQQLLVESMAPPRVMINATPEGLMEALMNSPRGHIVVMEEEPWVKHPVLVEGHDALAFAVTVFRQYEQLHKDKGTAEGLEKARRNGSIADRLEKTMKKMGVALKL